MQGSQVYAEALAIYCRLPLRQEASTRSTFIKGLKGVIAGYAQCLGQSDSTSFGTLFYCVRVELQFGIFWRASDCI